ncbi:MAG: hypothetical protein M1337_04895, partial [Actinobacteria bacterium]|nr:hypothetical protein [Actinomycetota bacterium]
MSCTSYRTSKIARWMVAAIVLSLVLISAALLGGGGALASGNGALKATSLVAQDTAYAGYPIDIDWGVDNLGPNAVTNYWYDTFYISPNPEWDGSATWLGYQYVPLTVAAGDTYSRSQGVTLPDLAAGTYYIYVRVDDWGYNSDPDRSNNVITRPITIGRADVNLNPTALEAPPSAEVGTSIPVTWTVKNTGTDDTPPQWWDTFYLSSDATWDGGDTWIGDLWENMYVYGGESYTSTSSFNVPIVGAGSYFLILRADGNYNIPETNEGDNDIAIPITITTPDSDLVPTAFNAPDTAGTGSQISLDFTVRNSGTVDINTYDWYDQLYLSETPDLSGANWYMTDWWTYGPLAAGASYSQTAASAWLPGVPPGNYYLVLRVDEGNYVPEHSKTNNLISRPITVTAADLVPTQLSGPPSGVMGTYVDISFTVRNSSTVGTDQGWDDYLYLSNTGDPNTGSSYGLYSQWHYGLAAGDAYTETWSVWLPGDLGAGNLYLMLRTDVWGYLPELDETNNVITRPITILGPDLVPTSVQSADPVLLGSTQLFTWTVQNQGSADAQPSWYDALYISTNPVYDGSATQVGYSSQNDVVAAGATYTLTWSGVVPNVAPGTYYLFARADTWNY